MHVITKVSNGIRVMIMDVSVGHYKKLILLLLPILLFGIVMLSPLINTAFSAGITCTDGDSDTLYNSADVIASIAGTTPSNSVGKASATGTGGWGCTNPFEADFSWVYVVSIRSIIWRFNPSTIWCKLYIFSKLGFR